MTSPAKAKLYEAIHVYKFEGVSNAVYNPRQKPLDELPWIYGFNNGGNTGFLSAIAIAESGHCLGSHCCSSESYMPHDLGILEGSRPDRHETFCAHYPDGYRMYFVPSDEVGNHAGLQTAFKRNAELPIEDGEKC